MPILSFIGHILTDLFGQNDNRRQIHKQTNSSFCLSNEMCLKNNVLGEKILAMAILYKSVAVHTSANAYVIAV